MHRLRIWFSFHNTYGRKIIKQQLNFIICFPELRNFLYENAFPLKYWGWIQGKRLNDFAKTSNLPKANFWLHFGTPFICWSLNKNPVQTKVRSLSILWQNCWNIIWLTVHRKLPFSGRRMAVFLKVRITFDWSKFLTDSTVPDSSPFFAMFWTSEEFLTTLTPPWSVFFLVTLFSFQNRLKLNSCWFSLLH